MPMKPFVLRPSLQTIGGRLLIMLLVTQVPLGLFTLDVVLENDARGAGEADRAAAVAEQSALVRLAHNITAAERTAAAAAALPPAILGDPANCRVFVAAMLRMNGDRLNAIALANPGGAVLCAGGGTGAEPGILALRFPGAALSVAIGVRSTLPGADPTEHSTAIWVGTDGPAAAAAADPGRWAPMDPHAAVPLPEPVDLHRLLASPQPLRLAAGAGRTALYAVLRPALSAATARLVLLAGSAAQPSGSPVAAMPVILRILEILVLCLAEMLIVTAGVSMVIVHPVRRLNAEIGRWRGGEPFRPIEGADLPLEIRELGISFREATSSLTQRELDLRGAILQQELAMQEIHHRVKNNLQIIASLLNLQASRIKAPEAKAEFQSTRDRVRALATLHRHLYADGALHMIDMHRFLTELCDHLFQSLGEIDGGHIKLWITAPEMELSSDQAVPLALIVTETVANAIKYAFPDERPGRITLTLATEGDRATLIVADDGVGTADRAPGGVGLGVQLVYGFARQLHAKLTVSHEGGTCYRLEMTLVRHHKLAAPADPAAERAQQAI